MKKLMTVLLLISVLMLAGCSEISSNAELMRPPRPTGDKAVIQDVLTELAGGDFVLKYPQNGENISAIIMEDFTSSGEADAAALYKPNSSEADTAALYKPNSSVSGIHAAFISEVSGTWQSIGDFTHMADEVDRVIFSDIDGDKSNEILIGWTNNNSAVHTLTAYDYDGSTMREMIIDDTYNEICLGDLTDNSCDEIILLSLATKDTTANAKILQYSENEKRPTARFSVDLSSDIVKYDKVTVGKLSDSCSCVFIDGETSNGVVMTEIIYWDGESGSFINPMYISNTETANQTSRNMTIYTQDIDGDGLLEMPVITEMPAGGDEDPATVCSLVSWKSFSSEEGTLITKLNTVINRSQNYCFAIPDRWSGNVTARVEDNNMIFYVWNTNLSIKTDKLLTISPNALDTAADVEITASNGKHFYAYIEQTDLLTKDRTTLQITKNEVQNGFYTVSSF